MSAKRLDKILADMGIASRSELKQIIKSGRVTVNGTVVTSPETKVDTDGCEIALDGEVLGYRRFRYYLMDKPAGVVTATDDKKQKTVLDLVSPEMRRMGLFPVGRLDKDTSGLLLLTNDGDFAHRVISPKAEVEKVYYAKVDGIPDESDVKAFAQAGGRLAGHDSLLKYERLAQEAKGLHPDLLVDWEAVGELRTAQVDMFTTVIVGNSATRLRFGRMLTPRGYAL